MTPEIYCRDKTRGSGSSFFYAFMFLPEDQRRAMMALYAFCREVDDVADEVSEQHVALAKLGFWREELGRAFAGKAQHPVGHELYWCAAHFPISEELLLEILDGMQTDVLGKPFVKQADLSLYIYRVAGVVGLLSIEVFGYTQRKSRDFATHLGEALQLTNILRDLADDAAIGRIYIPQDARSRYQLSDQAFKSGLMSESMQQLLQEYGEKAEQAYRTAIATLPPEDRESLRPSIVMGAIYYTYLRRLRQNGFDVWQQPVRILPARKIWVAWRAWRHERRACKHGTPIRLEF
ncbi:presqualene diphosphate synthase HpnD [Mariprofundus ferrooxydans]|uniref:Squalene/phytoene synthase n=1 Tax=Mariprofundus ferrooxydans PV-1 TaxID=314345 RepID=Q0F2I2_9PROT|nr:presqualene diphosphate synthase HpnD [Mariprofundus ferrooxydans]EAU55568.1 Squalene/phytoene synthase [Mariprofundus ferrooxydans PV-1]KON48691.1 squalene/phytoene synthase [Mariprofundus ferrooxydans]